MSAWTLTLAVATIAVMVKAVGPVALGGRRPPRRVERVLELLAPSLFAALILSQVFTDGDELALDARSAGLGAAAVAVLLRTPVVGVMAAAAAATADGLALSGGGGPCAGTCTAGLLTGQRLVHS